jgi:glutamine synthetase
MALAALVRAGLEGLRQGLSTPPLVAGDPANLSPRQLQDLNICRLPDSLPAALAALQEDAVISAWLPDALKQSYLALKTAEMEKTAKLTPAAQCDLYADFY